MRRSSTLNIAALVLSVAIGCQTCGERRTLFPRLRDAFDRDEAERERPPERDPNLVRRTIPNDCDCGPAGGTGVYAGAVGPGYIAGPVGIPTGYGNAPVLGAPIMIGPIGPGTPVSPGTPRGPDNELPPPGTYSPMRGAETGFSAPKPTSNLTGK